MKMLFQAAISGLAVCIENMQKHQMLYHLDISHNRFPWEKTRRIAEVLTGLISIRSLNISITNLLWHNADIFTQWSNLGNIEKHRGYMVQ